MGAALYEDMTQIELPKDPELPLHDRHDRTRRSTGCSAQKSLTPDKPFFIYFAPGATHAPHHVPKEWIAKYKGKFDQGWDKLREETLARQIKLGVVPAGTQARPQARGHQGLGHADCDEKKLFARQMEVFAGFGEYADTEIGRLIQAIEDLGQLDNTLIFYIVGDNGASAEGGMNGLFNEMTYFNGVHETVQDILKHYDELGGPTSYPHYAAGWAVAGDTPFTWTKQVAASYGGTRNGMVVHWPKRHQGEGRGAVAVASRHRHRADDPGGGRPARAEERERHAPDPDRRREHGSTRSPTPRRTSRHTTQYFEIFGNRAIYHDGWLAGTVHRAAWEVKPRRPLGDDTWELYDTRTDFSLANDLAAKNPEKLKELQELFLKEAVKYSVLPLDDRTFERTNAALVGRPDLMAGRTSLTVYEGMIGMTENVFINVKNRSHTITAEVEIPKRGANGVILSQAGRFGGWSLYLKDGKPTYTYNWLGLQRYTVAATEALPAGKATIRFEFAYDGGGIGQGRHGHDLRQRQEGRRRANRPHPGCIFSADEGADVGADEGTPVTDDYKEPTSSPARSTR